MSKLDQAVVKSLFELYKGGDFKTLAERAGSLLVSHPGELVLHSLLGSACLELEEYDAAIKSYKAALTVRPDFAKVHNSLGIAYLRAGQLEDALGSFSSAVKHDPQFAEACFNLGIVYENLQRREAAAECYKRAVTLAPNYYKAAGALAKTLWELGEHDQVAGHYEKALAVKADYLPARRGLLHFLEQSNQHEKLRDAIPRAGKALGAQHVLVRFYEGVMADIDGEHEKARSLLERIDMEPMSTRLFPRESVAKGQGSAPPPSRANENPANGRGSAPPPSRANENPANGQGSAPPPSRANENPANGNGKVPAPLRGDDGQLADTLAMHDERMRLARLTNICDKLNDAGAAIRYAERANHLSRELSARKGIGKERFLKFVENRRRYFTRDNIRQWQVNKPESKIASPPDKRDYETEQPIFIIGFPRSGTTLVDTILRGHPAIEVAEEIDAAAGMINRLAGYSDERLPALAELSDSDVEGLKKTYFDMLTRHVQPKDGHSRLIDRFALNIIYVGEIYRVFPNARFILMLRHPADCVLSCFMQTFHETSANANFHTLEDAAYLYDQVFSLWEQYQAVLKLNVLEVKYEDLIADVEKTCRPILDFIQAPWHPGLLDHEQTARNRPLIRTASYNQITRPLYSEAKGRWLRYRREMQPALPALEPWIKHFKYEENL